MTVDDLFIVTSFLFLLLSLFFFFFFVFCFAVPTLEILEDDDDDDEEEKDDLVLSDFWSSRLSNLKMSTKEKFLPPIFLRSSKTQVM